MVMGDQVTATRATLDEKWKASRAQLDWMHVPGMANYVNKLVTGRDLDDDGHWAIYARDRFLKPLATTIGRPLTMVSLGCGDAHIEEALIEFGWPISRLLGLEYDSALRADATERFEKICQVEASFQFYDFNAPSELSETYDLVFCCHAIHHATDLERLLLFINSLMNDDGLFVGIDYFGPARFQVEHDVRPIIDELYALLPNELKRDLRYPDAETHATFRYASIEEVRRADISEAVRSSDLRSMLFANFPIVEMKPMGGTLLRWLFQYRAGNFEPRNPCHMTIAKLLQMIERTYIEKGLIRSDDLFFVLRKSASI